MDLKYDISYQGDIIFVRSSGDSTYESGLKLWTAIVDACKKYNCFNVLGVQSGPPLSIINAYDHEKMFSELGISKKYRIAWVEEDRKTRDMLEYASAVLRNRGLVNGFVFSNIDDAKNWLMNSLDI